MSDNPFLLPPRGGEPVQPAAIPDAAPTPSVESATHRVQRPGGPEPVAQDEVAEETRVAPTASPATRAWVIELPDGTRRALSGPLLLGRNPAGIPDRPEAGLLAVVDPIKTVSKTHALLEPSADGVRVRDLHSTNGVAIDTAGERRLLTAGGEAIAPQGSTILLGSFPIGVAAG
jgi:hypothetical protein